MAFPLIPLIIGAGTVATGFIKPKEPQTDINQFWANYNAMKEAEKREKLIYGIIVITAVLVGIYFIWKKL